MHDVEFIDRESGKKVIEQVPGGGMIRFLYGQNFLGKFLLWAVVKRRIISVVMGWFMISKLSARTASKFIQKHKLDLSDFEVPKEGFKHFNSFFYRKLRPGVRVIKSGVVSPADGKILVFESIECTKKFYIKGECLDLIQFLDDPALAKKFNGGSAAVIRLAPTDYHRFHFPLGGEVGVTKRIEGDYFSVSPLALNKNMRIFWENKRQFTSIQTEKAGEVIVAEVGATLTGSIVQSHWPNITVKKGQEKGYFAFGGSTVIVLFENGKIQFSKDLVENSRNSHETSIKMGETIGMF